jgi:hypothetical protein
MVRGDPRKWVVIAAISGLSVALGVILASSSATASLNASVSEPRLAERQIIQVAMAAANGAGDRAPTLIQHSEGTREKANLIDSGDIVPGQGWSYLIAERGHFVLDDAPRPFGASAPRGSVLTLIVDAATDQVTDTGLSNRYPDLAKLGPVMTDLRRAYGGGKLPTVVVPNVGSLDLSHAYARLHRAGLRVSYPKSFSEGAFACEPIIDHETPAARSPVSAEVTITLTAKPPTCGVSSPGLPAGPLPSATVPNFASRPLSAAVNWAEKHRLYWEADNLPPLVGARASNLLGNYEVTGQRPRAGSTLHLGVGSKHGNEGSFRPTPLELRCRVPNRS